MHDCYNSSLVLSKEIFYVGLKTVCINGKFKYVTLLTQYQQQSSLYSVVLSHVWLSATPCTVAHQVSLSVGILQARVLEWLAVPSSKGSSQPRDRIQVSRIASGFFTIWATKEVQYNKVFSLLWTLEWRSRLVQRVNCLNITEDLGCNYLMKRWLEQHFWMSWSNESNHWAMVSCFGCMRK